MDSFARTQLLLGADGMARLRNARVAVFGLGGVGGYAVEALARSGIGALDLIDHDSVSITNINRQILATHQSVGRPKTQVAAERVAAIDPTIQVRTFSLFFGEDTKHQFDFTQYDYVIDAIDTVTAKLALISAAQEACTPIISCMGTGNKLDPTQFRIADISKTSVCPLARIMRKECAKRGIRHVKVLYSTEDPITASADTAAAEELPEGRRSLPGSVSFVPSVAGLMIAGAVICEIAQA